MSIEGSSCAGNQKPSDSELAQRPLPPGASLLNVSLCVGGITTVLASLPMNACYNEWTWQPVSTWANVLNVLLLATLFVLPIPVVAWWLIGLATSILVAFRRRSHRESLGIPLLGAGILLAWVIPYFDFSTWKGTAVPHFYGGVVFAIGCTVIFLSTLPGLYYWIRFRLSRKNGKT